ncbi:pentapeptide repeat-containing protein [Kitasatospora sp. NPDC001660]
MALLESVREPSTKAPRLGDANFDGATFSGDARFDGATFSGDAGFRGATFTGGARFSRAEFSGVAGFGGVRFLRSPVMTGSGGCAACGRRGGNGSHLSGDLIIGAECPGRRCRGPSLRCTCGPRGRLPDKTRGLGAQPFRS